MSTTWTPRACRRRRSSESIERMPKRCRRSGAIEPRGSSPKSEFESGLAAHHRSRHPVQVAGRRGQRRIEVRVGVEPKDEELASRLGGEPRDARDGTHRQAVVAAERDGRPPLAHDLVGLARQRPRPGGDFGETASLALGRRQLRQRGGARSPRSRTSWPRSLSALTMPAVRSIAGPMAQPATLAPASTGAPRMVTACGRRDRSPGPVSLDRSKTPSSRVRPETTITGFDVGEATCLSRRAWFSSDCLAQARLPPAGEVWILLDFLGFFRPNRAFSMAYGATWIAIFSGASPPSNSSLALEASASSANLKFSAARLSFASSFSRSSSP